MSGPGHRYLALLLLSFTLRLHSQSAPIYVGPVSCVKCHAAAHRQWSESLHSKMMQPATEQSVEGDFAAGKILLGNSAYALQHQNGKYFITESDLVGKPWQHRVEYTLGSRRFQHYLITSPDGRIVVLRPTWDIIRKRWVDVGEMNNPEEVADVQIWNKSCYGCHVSGEKKNFDVERLTYRTTWRSLGIDCETCHGPGSEHVARASGAKVLNQASRALIRAVIVNPARLDPMRSTMVCAQCHSFRDIYVDRFKAGANYYDFYQPVMEYRLPAQDDPPYWPDGRPRWISNEVFGLWQSQCFLKGGATCLTCHSQAHATDVERDPKLRPNNNSLCAKCHATITANITAHSHHAANSAGSSCIECHMPASIASLGATMRDHSISIPVPENTIHHNIPNACNLCHRDKEAEWTLQQMNTWYVDDKSRQKLIRRADAFTAARNNDATAIPPLLQILSDSSEGPLIRANAAGYLGSFPEDPSAYDAVLHSFSDSEPQVRATAAVAIRPRAAQRETAAPLLVSLLRDPFATVQVSAAIALVGMGVREVPGEDGEWFEHAKRLYRGRAELDSDDAQQQLAAGRFLFLSGDFDGAAAAFRATLKLDPEIPARYYLARALTEKGDLQSAREVLNNIPANDPQYAAAQTLLAQVEERQRSQEASKSTSSPTEAEAEAQFREGQSLYQNENYGGALKPLEEGLRLAPFASWATKAQIYRAICLEKLARTEQAEAAMQALSANAEARQNVDLQLAYVQLLYDTGRPEEALKRVDEFIAAVPQAPMAYFWRAKVLLELHRVDDAARAAEESIHLLPDLAVAHNLLIRIYQMQGHTAEAAREAEWMKDYERRMQGR